MNESENKLDVKVTLKKGESFILEDVILIRFRDKLTVFNYYGGERETAFWKDELERIEAID